MKDVIKKIIDEDDFMNQFDENYLDEDYEILDLFYSFNIKREK